MLTLDFQDSRRELSEQDSNEITFSFCQLLTAPPDICNLMSLYFTEVTTLSTVNLQVTEAHSSAPPQAGMTV